MQQDKAVQEYEKSGKPDGDLFVAMVYKGVDPNVASFLVQQEGFSGILRTQIALNDAIDANSFTQDSFKERYEPSQSSKRQTLGQAVLLNTVKLGEFIESIPYKEEREAAKKAIQLVTGGPIKFVISFGIDQAISYLDKVSDNVLSKGYAEVLDNLIAKLWTGSYKEEHFEKIGPEGSVFKGELVTIEIEQRVMDAKRPFLAEGISAIVGLAGITKAVKGKAQESKSSSHEGSNQNNNSSTKGKGALEGGKQLTGQTGKEFFPTNPKDLTKVLGVEPKVSTAQHGTTRMLWEPNKNTRIRYESHPNDTGSFTPRHHSDHYHVEVKPDDLTWGQAQRRGLVEKIKPENYKPGSGTGFLPNEKYPGM